MKQMAAGGFKDITRIASSSPEMWEQICMTNTGNIIDMMEHYIASLTQILDSLKDNNFKTEVGPGVYDIHSPRVPSVREIKSALDKMLDKIAPGKLWVNPDCGLKTRGVPETVASLKNLVEAAKEIRQEHDS